jgi:hypothetical protein
VVPVAQQTRFRCRREFQMSKSQGLEAVSAQMVTRRVSEGQFGIRGQFNPHLRFGFPRLRLRASSRLRAFASNSSVPAQRPNRKQPEFRNISRTTLFPSKSLGFRPKMPKMGRCVLAKSPSLKLIGLTSKIGPDLFRVVKQTTTGFKTLCRLSRNKISRCREALKKRKAVSGRKQGIPNV